MSSGSQSGSRVGIVWLRTLDGEFLPLKPGQTWYQVIRPTEQQTPEEEWLRVE